MSEHKIFITGIAGIFPSSKDVEELYVTIDSKNATFSSTDSYWKSVVPGIPPLIGKQPLNEKFDAGYFGIHYRLAEEMHQSTKKLLELSFEAIMDAGINPHDLKGSKTGVFVGTTNIECDIEWMSRKLLSPNFGVLGSSRSSLSEWISYYFQLQGPSMTIDSACTSSFSALDCAVLALKSGRCDNALVCSVNIIQNPHIHQGFQYLGILDLNGNNDVFDDLCGGYIRSEATTSIFLQLSQNSYKLYAEILGIKTNSDGFKLQGLTYPCSEAMFSLFRDVYEENGANSEDVAFIETHITGTSAGFVEELNAIKNAFCDGRKLPLFIGSVKANIGHSEASSGLVSLIKILLGLQHNCILPNPDFHTNSLRAKNLLDANLVVATDRIPLLNNQRVIIGCNNFGLGGTNAHLALKHHNQLQLQTKNYKRYPNRLVCFSARTKESLSKIAASIERNTTEEYLRFLQNIFRHNVCNYFYRGFTLLNNGKITKPSLNYCREKGQMCLIFPGASILSMPFLGEIKKSEALSESFKKICTIIRAINVHDLNLWDKMKKPDFGDLVLAVTILQLTTTDVLKNILQQPITLVESCCSGAIAAAFAIGVVSLENAILLALKLRKTIKTQNIMVGERCTFLHCPNAIKRIVLKELKCICVGLNTGSINQIYEKKCMPNQVNVIVGFEKHSGSLNIGPNTPWLQMLGRLYTLGFDLQLEKLYPNVNGPVKAPLISPLIDWDHSDNWNVLKFEPKDSHKTVVTISVDNNDWEFLTGHIIDGRNLVPAACYLVIVWDCYLKKNGLIKETTDIVFENVQFHRITVIQNKPIVLTIYFSKLQDKFEIKEEDDCIVKGTIRATRRKSKFNFNWREFPTFNLEQKMNTKDFYKKLNLHGYNYRNTFCCLHKVNLDVTHAQIKWIDWITFLDSMMQLCAFRSDLDKLNIPVQITQLFIDPELHMRALNNKKNILPVIYNTNSNTISAPGIEFGPILAMNIKKRSDREPVIEVYKFVPYDVEISLEESVLVNLQIAAENVDTSLTVIEVIDSFHNESDQLLCSVIERSQENSFMNVKDLCIYSCIDCEYPNFKVEKKTVNQLSREANFIILSRGSHRPNTIQQILQRSNCFVISREAKDFTNFEGAEVISIHRNYHESLVLLRKKLVFDRRIIELDHKFVWLEQLQMVLKTNKKVLLVAQNSDSGILGLMTSLKQEVGQNVACLFIPNCNREFNIKDEFYLKQLRKNISINVYKEGVWGSYRHLPFPDKNIECVHAVAFSNSNDISGVQYVEGSLTKESIEFEKFLIKVYYAALNFKDVVSVTGRISLENGRVYRSKYKRIGFEFAGVESSSGKRLMGVTCSDAFSNLISVTQSTTCLIPENWSIEEAATVPACYMTVLYGLLKICRLKREQSVLIHLGTGGVGQSAIHVALYYNCKIFVTVGSKKNREYIRTVFPMIPQCHIGNSRGTGFEQMILKLTGGKGVDLVINSLTEDQLLAGIRCVARRGTFLELGRYDQQLNKPLGIEAIGNKRACISFYLDDLLNLDPPKYSEAILLLENGIKKGYVKPLPRIVFNQNEIQDALHYMNLGKHVGKILLNYADSSVGTHKFLSGKPIFFCDSKKVYIIIGGLGGFGIELTDWLIGRGAQKLILVSRSGATTGYQHYKLKYWNELGCRVMLSQDDLTTEKGCTNLLDTANTLGVVDGIFNLSVVLSDALFENQSKESFQTVLEPKASITHNMDTMTRLRCPNLRYFVVFSSVTCGRGNLGQTNYGMANSIMERICEERVSVGYPALAIQWGIIGDVGLMSERYPKNQEIRGVTQQNISSCLDLMDVFLTGKEVIVSSLVCKPKTYDQVSKKDNFLSAIADILAIKNINHVSAHSTLSSLGLDSTTNVQLKQFLGSEHSMYFSTKELQNMTLSMLMERKNMN